MKSALNVKSARRFEDVEGSVYELVIHDERTMYKKYRNQEEVILNVAFCHFGILGEWKKQRDETM